MTKKFDEFAKALTSLCKEYGVMLATSSYDRIEVWDQDPPEMIDPAPTGIYADELVDRTKHDTNSKEA